MSEGTTAPEGHAATVREALARNVGVDLAARVTYLVSRFFIPPFVVAHIGLEAYGLWASVFILVSYVGMSTLGISNAYVKFIANYMAQGETEKANALLSTGVSATLIIGSVLFGITILGLSRVIHLLKVPLALQADARMVLLSVVGIFLLDLALCCFDDALTGCQRTAEVQTIWAISYLAETALIFALITKGFGIRGLAYAFVIRTLLANVLSAVVAYRKLSWLHLSPRRCSREAGSRLMSFGGVAQLQGLLAIALNSIERAIAAPLIGLDAAGLLDIGKKLPSMAASIPSAFASAFMPAAAYLHGGLAGTQEGREAIAKLYLKGARYMNLSAAYICGFLATSSVPILLVWMGKLYPGTALLLVLFSLSTQVHLMTGPGTSMLKGMGRLGQEFVYSLSNVAALAITLPASRLIVGSWTVVGIGCAVASATVASAIIFISWANHLLGIPARRYIEFVVIPGLVPYLAGMVFAVPAFYCVAHTGRWEGAVLMLGIGASYSIVLVAVVSLSVLELGERYWFGAVIRRHLGWLIPALRGGEA
jgi:O-antigen/teichoic acid export membrane protein